MIYCKVQSNYYNCRVSSGLIECRRGRDRPGRPWLVWPERQAGWALDGAGRTARPGEPVPASGGSGPKFRETIPSRRAGLWSKYASFFQCIAAALRKNVEIVKIWFLGVDRSAKNPLYSMSCLDATLLDRGGYRS